MSKPIPPVCERAREQLGLRVEGELDAGEIRELESHLASCAECREVESWVQRVDRLAAAEPDPGVTAAHLAELEARILHGLPTARRRPWWRRFALPALVPSAALVMFVFLIVRETTPDRLDETPVAGGGRANELPSVTQSRLDATAEAPVDQLDRSRDADDLRQQPVAASPLAGRGVMEAAELQSQAELASSEQDEPLPDDAEMAQPSEIALDGVEATVAQPTALENRLLDLLLAYRATPDPPTQTLLIALLSDEQRESRGVKTMSAPSSGRLEKATVAEDSRLKEALRRWLESPTRVPADSLTVRAARALLEELE